MSKTDKKREEFDKRFLVKKGYLEPDGDKVIFTYDGKKEKKFALVRGGYDELWDWIEKALDQKEAEVLRAVQKVINKNFDANVDEWFYEELDKELNQLKTK